MGSMSLLGGYSCHSCDNCGHWRIVSGRISKGPFRCCGGKGVRFNPPQLPEDIFRSIARGTREGFDKLKWEECIECKQWRCLNAFSKAIKSASARTQAFFHCSAVGLGCGHEGVPGRVKEFISPFEVYAKGSMSVVSAAPRAALPSLEAPALSAPEAASARAAVRASGRLLQRAGRLPDSMSARLLAPTVVRSSAPLSAAMPSLPRAWPTSAELAAASARDAVQAPVRLLKRAVLSSPRARPTSAELAAAEATFATRSRKRKRQEGSGGVLAERVVEKFSEQAELPVAMSREQYCAENSLKDVPVAEEELLFEQGKVLCDELQLVNSELKKGREKRGGVCEIAW
jgi:hypothetical protein